MLFSCSLAIDLKFEEAFCLFLLGQGTEAEAIEQLKRLELNSNSNKSVSGKAIVDVSATNLSLANHLSSFPLNWRIGKDLWCNFPVLTSPSPT
ncbi:hypothetical protein QN277_005552 [Acacia crassicarpa]|uniref:Uncharacterized protein n=1 Tax=Acacia crassicarpa TaxID=499986 RepID=A0AAE1MGI6_9FABA|nr:hypothetical protein QN277_005552 [Acacia crassicarpa]